MTHPKERKRQLRARRRARGACIDCGWLLTVKDKTARYSRCFECRVAKSERNRRYYSRHLQRDRTTPQPRVPDLDLMHALREQPTIRRALMALGMSANGSNYARAHGIHVT